VFVKRLTKTCSLWFLSGQAHLKCAKHQHESSAATLPQVDSPHLAIRGSQFENDTVRVNRSRMQCGPTTE
jgi:hypothetical protein